MRNAYIIIGIGAIVLVAGGWYLTTLNTSSARNTGESPIETANDTNEGPKDPISEIQGAAIGEGNEMLFTCAGGKSMTAIFTRDILALTLSDGRQITLRDSSTPTQVRYMNTNASVELHGVGDQVFLEENGATTYFSCSPDVI